jgi:membrane fusion protein (multidrug efflux system)
MSLLTRKSLSMLILAALASGSLAACGRGGNEEAAEQAAPQPVVLGPADVTVVVQGPVESGPALSGTLTAQDQATVRAQIGGSVLETYAEPGEPVRRGQRLARLAASSLGSSLASARAAVTTARSNLALAEREQERQRTLAAAGAVAERNVDTAEQQVVAARANLAQAQAQLASAQEQLGYSQVTAPISGVVSERQVSAGDVVQPGAALYTVVDPSSLELEASIAAERIAALHVGAPVAFQVNGFPNRTFRGRITRINPAADPVTRQVRVYAEIPNSGSDLVAGLFAEGRVQTEIRNGLTVPTAAVDRRMMQPAVLRVRDGKVERVPVQLGLLDEQEQKVELRQGVEAGDVVLLGAAQEIPPGTPVRLAPAAEQSVERLAQQ